MNCKINVFGQIELFRIVDKFSFESEKFSQVLFKLQTVSHKSHATDKKLANKFQISKRSNVTSRALDINFVVFSLAYPSFHFAIHPIRRTAALLDRFYVISTSVVSFMHRG